MPIGGTAFFGQNQHLRLTTTYLNQLNRRGDPGPGLNISSEIDKVHGGTIGFSGGIAQPYAGFIGGKCTFTDPWVTAKADPAVGPLYGGIYMYCRVDPAATAPLVRGSIVFWLDELNYIVTAAGQSGSPLAPNKMAGVAVNNTWPGYWDFFQIAGIAMVLLPAAGTIGQTVTVDPTSGPPVAPAVGAAGAAVTANFLGTVRIVPAVANQVNPVEINIVQGYNF